jgi:hypothetical protein
VLLHLRGRSVADGRIGPLSACRREVLHEMRRDFRRRNSAATCRDIARLAIATLNETTGPGWSIAVEQILDDDFDVRSLDVGLAVDQAELKIVDDRADVPILAGDDRRRPSGATHYKITLSDTPPLDKDRSPRGRDESASSSRLNLRSAICWSELFRRLQARAITTSRRCSPPFSPRTPLSWKVSREPISGTL